MHEQQIEDIKNALREMMQLLVSRGQPINDEIKVKIAQVMEHAANRITQLRQEQAQQGEQTPDLEEAEEEQAVIADQVSPPQEPPAPPSEPIPELNPAPHESSNINAFRYEPKTGKLFVKFQDKYPGTNGPIYSYEGVPPFIYKQLKRGSIPPKTSGKNAWHTWEKGVTPSHGAAMFKLIKQGGYSYRKLS